jgi:para-nitrobenzyl esterase
VSNHISRFGGDPRRVTLLGESAGGYSVCVQYALPRNGGLLAGALMESGGCDAQDVGER